MKLYYVGTVKNGVVNVPKKMKSEIAESFEGKHIKITVERNKSVRSNAQNSYYWGVVLPYVLDGFIEVGNRMQRNAENIKLIHELMKSKFLDNGAEIADAQGQVYSAPPTTTTLNKSEMGDYIEIIKDWAKEYLNIQIPNPE